MIIYDILIYIYIYIKLIIHLNGDNINVYTQKKSKI